MNRNFDIITKSLSHRLRSANINSVIVCSASAYAKYEFSVIDIKRSLHIIALATERPEVAYLGTINAVIARILSVN